MSNFGAIVKAFADLVDHATAIIEHAVIGPRKNQQPKPCPIYVPVKADSHRR